MACPNCGGVARLAFRTIDFNRRVSRETFRYLECTECGVIFLQPVPDNLGAYYAAGYHHIPGSLEELRPLADADLYKLELVQDFVPSGRLLEIGPGVGAFAFLARTAGFEVEAVEMDAECCRFLEQVVGVRTVESSDPRQALTVPARYDVIALWHVIEHLADPWDVMAATATALRPGGVLVIATPNPQALQYWLFRKFWTHVDAPRHLQLIPAAALINRAKQSGLRVERVTSSDSGGLGWNRFGWQGSFRNLTGAVAATSITQLLGRAASRIARPVERTGMRGSTYTVVLSRSQDT